MSRRLPPLNALRAFEAAGRHLSFRKAAEELHVTPAAVSQQVKALEDLLGVPLFRRLTRALMLTDAGQAALPPLRDGFDKLAEAMARLEAQQDSGVITVSVAPSFGAKWLVPRLDRFRRRHPQYDLRIDATDSLVDFARDGVDVALRYGKGSYPGLVADCLLDEFVFPVCSPRLRDGPPPLRRPEDLRHHTLLHVDWRGLAELAPSWRMWLHAAGVGGVDADRGPRFSMESMTVQAAIEGQGVALAPSTLVADDLAAGRLVRPFGPDDREAAAFCYYVVYPKTHAGHAKVAAFRDWVLAEAASGAAAA